MAPRNGCMSFWNRDDISARFVELFNEGFSHTIIAAKLNHEFGTDFTRFACIGRAYRLGMTGRVPNYTNQMPRGRKSPTPASKPPEPVVGLGITLNQLGDRTCRYPLPGEQILFCGLETESKGQSWCPYHRHVSTQREKRGGHVRAA